MMTTTTAIAMTMPMIPKVSMGKMYGALGFRNT